MSPNRHYSPERPDTQRHSDRGIRRSFLSALCATAPSRTDEGAFMHRRIRTDRRPFSRGTRGRVHPGHRFQYRLP